MDFKPCDVKLPGVEIAENAAKKLKASLSKWKAKTMSNHALTDTHSTGDYSDPELEPVNLLSGLDNSIGRSHRPCSINLNTLFTEYKEHKPKVEIVVNGLEAAAADEAETAAWRQRMRQDNEIGRGKIRKTPPGIEWLQCCSPVQFLSLLPIPGAAGLCESDVEIISLLKCPSSTLSLTANFTLLYQLVENKAALLNNMFIAMCIHSQTRTVEVLRKCINTLLTHSYGDVDSELDSWSPRFSDIQTVMKYIGAAESYSECPASTHHDLPKETENESPQRNENIKALLDIIACTCKYRKPYTADELIELSITVAKLSLDTSLLSQVTMSHFQCCMHSLISVPDVTNSPTSILNMEHELCRQLLSIVEHHHNKLHLVTIIPALSERAATFRMTLAYLAISQLRADDQDFSDCDFEGWSLNKLAHKYFSLEVTESVDMYFLHTLVALFDIAIGPEIDFTEKEDLDAMRELMSKQCGLLRESPMRPDISTTKYFMHRVVLRWSWVVRQAMPAEEVLDFKYKPTPTKVIPVNSQEVRVGPSDDEDGESRDTCEKMECALTAVVKDEIKEEIEGVNRSLISPECEVPFKLKPKDSFSPSFGSTKLSTLPISPSGLERLRSVARELYGASPPGSRPHTPNATSHLARFPGDGTKPLIKKEDAAPSTYSANLAPSPPLSDAKPSLSLEGDTELIKTEMEVEDLPDLD